MPYASGQATILAPNPVISHWLLGIPNWGIDDIEKITCDGVKMR
jgi:hypothetical protein